MALRVSVVNMIDGVIGIAIAAGSAYNPLKVQRKSGIRGLKNLLILMIITLTLPSIIAPAVANAQEDEENLVTVYVGTYPTGLPIVIDGVVYFPSTAQPIRLQWEKGSLHTVEIIVDIRYTDEGERYVFKMWNTGEDRRQVTVVADKPKSIVAIYEKEYFLEIISPYGNPQGTGWYPAGSLVEISVEETVEIEEGVRASFLRWSEGYNPESSQTFIYLFEPKTVKAQWKIEYLIKVSAEIEEAQVSEGGWFEEGSLVTITAQEEVGSGEAVWRFSGWRVESGAVDPTVDLNSRTLSLKVIAPATLVAQYERYYYVEVLTPVGEAEGTGYYREGDIAVASVPEIVEASEDTRYVFTGWTGDLESPSPRLAIKVEKPLKIVATWKAQYKVDVESNIPEIQNLEGDGWYSLGEKARLNAPQTVSSSYGIKYVFAGWRGDYNSSKPSDEVTVTGPMKIEAVYVKSYTGFYLNVAAVATVIVGVYLGYTILLPKILNIVKTRSKNE
ncbi:hypothetical protein apy_10920 [Aeropyrum pernix]|uniref:Bacterial repeat domain-containing protein n=1 Tax=Aeropyrum pernix TaxID=56636 RepID=A0A401HAD9_AERPX|nr:hypothetical protein [Aeropyrum pernix]GBF09367.1 hypothetical protein apy_10920 [Aeropyrum pernix]